MPYASRKEVLDVANLPFAAHYIRTDQTIEHTAITAALRCVLPQVGLKLKSLEFSSDERFGQLANSHVDLIIQFCPGLVSLIFGEVRKMADLNLIRLVTQLRQLTHLCSFSLDNCWSSKFGETHMSRFLSDLGSLMAIWPLKTLALSNFCTFLPTFVTPHLIGLTLHNCDLSDVQLAQICRTSPKLCSLDISGGRLTDFSPIAELKELTKLNLSSSALSNNQMRQICAKCAKLMTLSLSGCQNLTNFRSLQFLNELNILVAPLSDAIIADLPRKWALSNLKLLALTDAESLTDEGLAGLRDKFPLLKSLVIASKTNVTDCGIVPLVTSCESLTFVILDGTSISDKSLVALAESQSIRKLTIEGCSNVTTEGFWLLCLKRLQKDVQTPLDIRVGSDHPVWDSPLLEELKAELRKVKVTFTDELIQFSLSMV